MTIVKFKILTFKNISFFLFFYLTLVTGFFFGENLNYGSYGDWIGSNREPIKDFSNNFTYTFLNFDSYGHRHSPVYLIFLSLFLDLGLDLNQIRLVHLHLSISLIIVFYQCLRLLFSNINNNYLFLLSLIIFLSPTFRSLAIWPDSRLPGLIFFVLTIYFFLKFRKTENLKYTWYTCISLVVSSYISPNFSVFFVYFFFFFLKKVKFRELSFLLIFNFLASLPILYYIFILDVNFLAAGKTPGLNNESINFSFNLSDKLMIISSIIFFHLSPIVIMDNFFNQFKSFLDKGFIIIVPLVVCLIYFFNYQLSYTGGGVFFILSNLLFDNNYLFYIGSFFFISFVLYIASLSLNNFFLLTLLIVSNIQNTIYHKYYEPLVLIMFFTLIKYPGVENFLKKKNNIFYLYLVSVIYIVMRVFKINYLV
ncbi:hypothetical protein N9A34_03640 [Candidatus Pelagibacter sp.]|nr:hypothetical protein [Candidatus Pelagibacter sp.]